MRPQDAIDQSISHNEIVHVYPGNPDAFISELEELCNEECTSVKTTGQYNETMVELWSTSGEDWRVHVHFKGLEPSRDEFPG